MSRSGYTEDWDDPWPLIQWRGRVASAIRGKRGQRFLRELRDALDAMPEKSLDRSEDYEIVNEEGGCCALGAVALQRGWESPTAIDSSEHDGLGERLDIASCLVQEIEWENDEGGTYSETPEKRWGRVRAWVEKRIKPSGATPGEGEGGGRG